MQQTTFKFKSSHYLEALNFNKVQYVVLQVTIKLCCIFLSRINCVMKKCCGAALRMRRCRNLNHNKDTADKTNYWTAIKVKMLNENLKRTVVQQSIRTRWKQNYRYPRNVLILMDAGIMYSKSPHHRIGKFVHQNDKCSFKEICLQWNILLIVSLLAYG